MDKKYLPEKLERERDDKIKQAQWKAKKVKILNYVKIMIIPGIILAVPVFFSVGPQYEALHGFDGSAGAAFGAALKTIIGFAILGAFLGFLVKMFRLNQVDRIAHEYNEKAEEFSNNVTKMTAKFANNERIQSIISKVVDKFSSTIQSVDRPNYEKEISISTTVFVAAKYIRYDGGTLDFKLERLAELATEAERKAMAQAIVEGVAARINNQFPKDLSGTTPSVSVSCDEERLDDEYSRDSEWGTYAYVTYECTNGSYKETIQW